MKLEKNEPTTLIFPEVTALEAERILDGHAIGTYLLRTDPSGEQYLSGIHSDSQIHHARLEQKLNFWLGFNGDIKTKMIYKADTIFELASIALDCSPYQCTLID